MTQQELSIYKKYTHNVFFSNETKRILTRADKEFIDTWDKEYTDLIIKGKAIPSEISKKTLSNEILWYNTPLDNKINSALFDDNIINYDSIFRANTEKNNVEYFNIYNLIDNSNWDKYISVYEQFAKNGNIEAYNNLGIMMAQKGKYTEAHRYFKQGAESGSGFAMFNLVNCGYDDEIPFDSKLFIYWIEKAAEKDIIQAMYNLAICYHFGLYVPIDLDKADFYYKKIMLNEKDCFQYIDTVKILYQAKRNWIDIAKQKNESDSHWQHLCKQIEDSLNSIDEKKLIKSYRSDSFIDICKQKIKDMGYIESDGGFLFLDLLFDLIIVWLFEEKIVVYDYNKCFIYTYVLKYPYNEKTIDDFFYNYLLNKESRKVHNEAYMSSFMN